VIIGVVTILAPFVLPRSAQLGTSVPADELTQANLKQLAAAMLQYHDAYRRLPASAQLTRHEQTPHSWRVALLPYLGRQDLYEQYRFDEPWDSPANRNVLEDMPDVFRSPFDERKSTNSGYYAVVGRRAMFERDTHVRIRDVLDGTRNTILVVESKQGIPWTKPEDIPFDPLDPAPALGGFMPERLAFITVAGEPHIVSQEKIEAGLKFFIIRDDMQLPAVLTGEQPPDMSDPRIAEIMAAELPAQPVPQLPEVTVSYAPRGDEFESGGVIRLGPRSPTDNIYISNAGDALLELSGLTLPEGWSLSGDLTQGPVRLAPGKHTSLTIKAQGHKEYSQFKFFTNDPDEPEFELRLAPRRMR